MLRRSALQFFFLVSLFYVALNSYSSQTVHPLYFQQVANENEHAIEYLSIIKTLPEFEAQYKWYNSVAADDIHDQVYRDTIVRTARITQLEEVLTRNPNSPVVLSALSKLYGLQGNDVQAEMYKTQAKQIDPGLE